VISKVLLIANKKTEKMRERERERETCIELEGSWEAPLFNYPPDL
jgi:hypothetical protein